MDLYKVCYSIGFRRRQVLCADKLLALRVFIMVCRMCRASGHYHQPRFYRMEKGEWKENEQE